MKANSGGYAQNEARIWLEYAALALEWRPEHGWRVGRRLQSRDQVSPGKEWSSGVSSSVSSSHTPHLPGVTHQDSLCRGVLSSFLQVSHLEHENARIILKHECQPVLGHCSLC